MAGVRAATDNTEERIVKAIEQLEIWYLNLDPRRRRNVRILGGIVCVMVVVAVWNIVR